MTQLTGDGGVVVEKFRSKHFDLAIEQPQGFWCRFHMVGRIPMSPDEIYEILTSRDNHRVFHNVDPLRSRRVLEENAHGEVVEIEQVGKWRLGPFRGSFGVKLIVTSDHRHRTVSFKLAPINGKRQFMHDFTGTWKVAPYNEDSIDEMIRFPNRNHWGPIHNLRKAIHQFEDAVTGRKSHESLVELRQSVKPAFLPPGPLANALRKITAAQVAALMEDLLEEANRRNESEEKTGIRTGRLGIEKKDSKSLSAHIRELR